MNHKTTIPSFDESLIIRHFNQECSPEEEAALLSWIDAADEHLESYLKMKQLWALRRINYYASDLELNRARAKVEEKIRRNKQHHRQAMIRHISRYAAVAIFILGGFLLYHSISKQKTSGHWITISTVENGAVRMITLPDSTKVWLNENTSLSYPETFNQRLIKLEGEAFFEVRPDATRTFMVDVNTMQIHVLGTSFNVKNYPIDETMQVTLVEGKVELYDDAVLLASLHPGQQATCSRYEPYTDVQSVRTELYTSWRTGLVLFDKAYLADILAGIEKSYQVRIIYNANRPSKKQYNFVFRKNQPIETVLDMLQFIAPISYKINQDEVYINEK